MSSKPSDKYTIPKIKYNYQVVPWEKFLENTYDGYKTVRSSFIPYVVLNGEKYWVLGSFQDYPGDILMDFGGSCIVWDPPRQYANGRQQRRHYQHQFGCAFLELNEESKGLLVQPVLRSLGTSKPVIYRGINNQYREYVWFAMVQLDYPEIQDIISRFPSAPYVLKKEKLGPIGLYKESDVINGKYRTTRNLTDFLDFLRQ
jgi:hypothetical protein